MSKIPNLGEYGYVPKAQPESQRIMTSSKSKKEEKSENRLKTNSDGLIIENDISIEDTSKNSNRDSPTKKTSSTQIALKASFRFWLTTVLLIFGSLGVIRLMYYFICKMVENNNKVLRN